MNARQQMGKNLLRLRKAAGLTQEEFAHRAALHPTYVSGIEGGHRNPSVDVLERIAQALGVGIAELFS